MIFSGKTKGISKLMPYLTYNYIQQRGSLECLKHILGIKVVNI